MLDMSDAFIAPFTYGAVHLKMGLILGKLQPDPYRFAVVVAVPVGERVDCLLGLAACKS